ncbi:hypothetical protein CEW88_19025 [Alloyangia pacifica]|uniref:HTH araC/xylS-type domain-containing protein n=2 Tax=Alloyangia pacifica TaxID=311180 RepID=A0A2U8HL16_9RHOB|nr:hypothetical protein CEW88_19025 [Alloyangia pacifica]
MVPGIYDFDVARALRPRASLLRSGVTASGIGLAVWEQRRGEVHYRAADHHTFSLYLRGGSQVREVSSTAVRPNSAGSPGAICTLPAGDCFAWNNEGYLRWLHVYFRDRHMSFASGSTSTTPARVLFGCDPALRELCQRFLLVLDWADPDQNSVLDHALMTLLARSLAIENVTSDFRAPNGGLTGAQRRAVEDTAETSLADRITVRDLAEVSGLSPRQFSRAFTVSYGTSPYEWVLRQRVERARDLLADGEKARDVAVLCGFSSQTHMIRRFRAVFGYTPNAVR